MCPLLLHGWVGVCTHHRMPVACRESNMSSSVSSRCALFWIHMGMVEVESNVNVQHVLAAKVSYTGSKNRGGRSRERGFLFYFTLASQY